MTLDGFLTFLALAAAIYAVVPPIAKLKAKLGLAIQVPLAVIALALVLYFEFFEILRRDCPNAIAPACKWLTFPTDKSFTPPQAAFIVVLVWMVLAWSVHKLSRPTGNSLPAMSRLIDELLSEQRFGEALKFVEPHLPLINKAARRQLPLQRLRDRIAKYKSRGGHDMASVLLELGTEEVSGSRLRRFFDRALRWLGHLSKVVPAQRKPETAANDIARVLFRTPGLRQYMVRMRPYFATRLLKVDLHDKHDFVDAYFGDLISDSGSVLYQELEQNQNLSSNEGYWLPERNRLLHFLLADACVAKNLSVWRPIGEHILKILRSDRSPDYVAYLNGTPHDFEDARWKDPTFAGMFFFDLMVTTAAHQGVRWHMWLYYFPYFVERLEEIYDDKNPHVDMSDEFPTRSAQLIYEAINTLGSWVQLVKHLPEGSPHREINPGFHGDNGNIPVSAALALGSCMVTIVMSDKLSDKFASYMHEVVMRDMRDLRRDGVEGQMRNYLIQCLISGGQRRSDADYRQRLSAHFSTADHVLRGDLDDYKAALEAGL